MEIFSSRDYDSIVFHNHVFHVFDTKRLQFADLPRISHREASFVVSLGTPFLVFSMPSTILPYVTKEGERG